jgi:tRNA pseudouridine55 synthase
MVKRLVGERHVGHAGTLDPAATGVLPVCLGQATRIVEFLLEATKVYRAQLELGVATDTYDATGNVTYRGDSSGISQEQLESALIAFRGLIWQIPPMYSAVKHCGKPLYQLARAGIEVERRSRLAKIYRLEVVEWQPPLATVEVECGKGTYIRSLAHDLGQALGCGANLKSLVRLRCGAFDINDAVSIPQLEDAFRCGYWQHLVYPIDVVLSHWSAMVVNAVTAQTIRDGHPLVLEDGTPGRHSFLTSTFNDYCRVYTTDGCLLGVLRFNPEKRHWQPEKVFLREGGFIGKN